MKIVCLQPPSPPFMNVKRDYAGGMGVADPSERSTFGHDRGYITLPYMSLLLSAAVLERAGHAVSFVDAQADGLSIDEVCEVLTEHGPDVVVSVANLPSVHGDMQVLKEVRTRLRDVKTITMGTVCGPLFDEITGSGAYDAVVCGDPESLIGDLVQIVADGSGSDAFERRRGVLTNKNVGHIEDLDALPRMPYHLVPLNKYWYHGFGEGVKYAAVFASRGCSYQCYYCPYPVGFGDYIVHRDPVKVVDEIEVLQKQYGVRGILFRDQVFSMDWDKVHRLCDEIIRRELALKWVVETRLDRVNGELLSKMKTAGCVRIHYGLESGDPKLFSRVGKDGAEDRMQRLIQNFTLTERLGIHPHMFTLIGLLGENWATIENTIKMIRRIKPLTLQVAIVTPYPGTPLFDEMKAKGLILTEDWSQYTGFKAVARTEFLTAEDLVAARNRIITEHKKAIRVKRAAHLARLAWQYSADGSLVWRMAHRFGRALGKR